MRTTTIEQAGSGGQLWKTFRPCNLLVLASWNHSQVGSFFMLKLLLHPPRMLCNDA
jgi:hypothetical protein